MTSSSPSSSPPTSSSPGEPSQAPAGDPGAAPPAAEEPRDATRGGVNGPALPVHPPEGGHGKAPLSIDLCGEICPFTFVRTKLALEAVPIGAVLRVIVDHEPAIRNIPRSAAEWGQEVLGVSRPADAAPGTWAIDLRKRVR